MIAKKLEIKIRDAILSASRTHGATASLFAQDASGLSNLQRPRMFYPDSIPPAPLLNPF
jgi:hypothetical protein